jgi:hypothetical protein
VTARATLHTSDARAVARPRSAKSALIYLVRPMRTGTRSTPPRRPRPAALAAIAALVILAGCGGSSGGGGDTNAATSAGSPTTAQASGSKTTDQGAASTSKGGGKTSTSPSSKPNGQTSQSGLPAKTGPANKIKGCLQAGNASVNYTPKAHGYGALLATGPGGGQMMIIAAPTPTAAKAFVKEFKPSQPVDIQRSKDGTTISIVAKSGSSTDRSLAVRCAGQR